MLDNVKKSLHLLPARMKQNKIFIKILLQQT